MRHAGVTQLIGSLTQAAGRRPRPLKSLHKDDKSLIRDGETALRPCTGQKGWAYTEPRMQTSALADALFRFCFVAARELTGSGTDSDIW